MFDIAAMISIMFFLFGMLTIGCEYYPQGNTCFFNATNSKAMRGFWCIIVILVHVPSAYQNKLQDMIGSFAYIGVTFFFMTSAYGLSFTTRSKPFHFLKFLYKRLPKLLIPNFIVNLFSMFLAIFLFRRNASFSSLISVDKWVRWQIVCYLFFALGHFCFTDNRICNTFICVLVIVFSLVINYCQTVGFITDTTWCSEIYGFMWGTLLFIYRERFLSFFQTKWITKLSLLLCCVLLSGVAYLKFKPVVFWGDYVLKIFLGVLILCFMLAVNCRISIGNKVSLFLGEISFEIYLTHHLAFGIIKNVCGSISSGPFIILSILTTIVISTTIHFFCKSVFKKLKF